MMARRNRWGGKPMDRQGHVARQHPPPSPHWSPPPPSLRRRRPPERAERQHYEARPRRQWGSARKPLGHRSSRGTFGGRAGGSFGTSASTFRSPGEEETETAGWSPGARSIRSGSRISST